MFNCIKDLVGERRRLLPNNCITTFAQTTTYTLVLSSPPQFPPIRDAGYEPYAATRELKGLDQSQQCENRALSRYLTREA